MKIDLRLHRKEKDYWWSISVCVTVFMYAKWQLMFLKNHSRRVDGYLMIPGWPAIDLAHQVVRPRYPKNQQHRPALIVKKKSSDDL